MGWLEDQWEKAKDKAEGYASNPVGSIVGDFGGVPGAIATGGNPLEGISKEFGGYLGEIGYDSYNKAMQPNLPPGMSAADMNAYLLAGRKRGEELTGMESGEVGKKRGEIRTKYEDILNAPSRGASRAADARNADLRNLRANQNRAGISGPMAQAQANQMKQKYAKTIGDVRQNEYMNSLNKLDQIYRGVGKDQMTAEGQYAAIGVGAAPAPQMPDGGTSFICSKLRELGLMTKKESYLMTKFMLAVAFESSIFLYWYFSNMKEVVDKMDLPLNIWKNIKKRTVLNVIEQIKNGDLVMARYIYIVECVEIAKKFNVDIPTNLTDRRKLRNFPYFLLIFTKLNTWKWLIKNSVPKLKKKYNLRSCHG